MKTDLFSQQPTTRHAVALAEGAQPSTPRSNRGLFRDADVLWFGEKVQRFFAAFAADAALFHSAKGNAQIAHKPAIHPNRAGVDLLCDTMGASQILCPNT